MTRQVDLRDLGAAAYSQCYYVGNGVQFNSCVHGRQADEAALLLLTDTSARLILIDSFAASDETPGVEQRRARYAWEYLVYEKGVDPGRVAIRWGRMSRLIRGKLGGSLRFLVVRTGDRLPDFLEEPPPQNPTPALAPN